MSNQKQIEELRKQIRDKEGQLYRAEKDMTTWNSGKFGRHSNAKTSRLFIDSCRKEVSVLRGKLRKLESEE